MADGKDTPKGYTQRYLLKSSGKIQAKTPQEVKTTPSQDDLDLVKGLKRSGRALHAPKLHAKILENAELEIS